MNIRPILSMVFGVIQRLVFFFILSVRLMVSRALIHFRFVFLSLVSQALRVSEATSTVMWYPMLSVHNTVHSLAIVFLSLVSQALCEGDDI